MKRAGNLLGRIAEPENLPLAYLKAVRGKRAKAEAIEFAARLDENLRALRGQILAVEPDLQRHAEALLAYVESADALELRRSNVARSKGVA